MRILVIALLLAASVARAEPAAESSWQTAIGLEVRSHSPFLIGVGLHVGVRLVGPLWFQADAIKATRPKFTDQYADGELLLSGLEARHPLASRLHGLASLEAGLGRSVWSSNTSGKGDPIYSLVIEPRVGLEVELSDFAIVRLLAGPMFRTLATSYTQRDKHAVSVGLQLGARW